MVTYAIGDIQGCGASLAALLARLPLDPARDALWFAGDLVNRGPRSLDALRQVVALSAQYGERCVSVLGNHDLHLLAVADGLIAPHRGDTLDDILAAPDRGALLDWLRRRPLLHRQELVRTGASTGSRGGANEGAGGGAAEHVLVHAGLHPAWSVPDAGRLASDVGAALVGARGQRVLAAITQHSPDRWDESLAGDERLAAVAAVMTRMRTCRADGRMCRDAKGPPAEAPRGCIPWYEHPQRRSRSARVVFGHWAALGLHVTDDAVCLDSGCVWGGPLTALRLEDGALFQQPNVEQG